MAKKVIYVKDEKLFEWAERYCENCGISFSALIAKLLEDERNSRRFSGLTGDVTPHFLKK
jgi:hypothetical protein